MRVEIRERSRDPPGTRARPVDDVLASAAALDAAEVRSPVLHHRAERCLLRVGAHRIAFEWQLWPGLDGEIRDDLFALLNRTGELLAGIGPPEALQHLLQLRAPPVHRVALAGSW